MKRVLVPVDGPKAAEAILGTLPTVCQKDDTVMLLSIQKPERPQHSGSQPGRAVRGGFIGPSGGLLGLVTPDVPVFTETEDQAMARQLSETKDSLASVVDEIRAAGFYVTAEVRTAEHPARAVVEFARQVSPDLIVMLRLSHPNIGARLLGSVTSAVIVAEIAPVLIVPQANELHRRSRNADRSRHQRLFAPTPSSSQMRASTAGSTSTLRRHVGLVGATISGTGVIVGAGVYALVGASAGIAGNAVWMAFVVASVVAGLAAISYARMGRRVVKDSPEFQYTSHGLGFTAGFVSGWLMLWADTVAAAAVALAFGGYFSALIGVPLVFAALSLVLILALVASAGIKESILVISALTLAEVAGLVFVIVVGVPSWGDQDLLQTTDGFSGIWAASSLIFFAYIGFDELGNLAEEMTSPERDMPRAIVFAMLASTILYVLVAISAVSLIGADALGSSSAPLADAVERALGSTGRTVLAVLALAATSNTVLLLMLSVSRSIYGMSRSGALPAALGKVSERQTPVVGMVCVVGIVSGFVLLGDIAAVARVATFATLIAFSMVNISLARVVEKEAGSWRRAIRQPASIVQPLLGAVACLWLATEVGAMAIAAGAVLCSLGLAIALVVRTRRNQEAIHNS